MSEDTVGFTVRLPPGQHEKWTDYVDESPDLTSLTQLVRVAVEAEIRGDQSDDLASIRDDLRDTSVAVQQIQTEHEDVINGLNRLTDTVREVKIRTVGKNRLLRRLPESEEDALTVEEAALFLEEPEPIVVELLDELVLEYERVRATTVYGATAYYHGGNDAG